MEKVTCPKCYGEMNEGAMRCYTCKRVVNMSKYIIYMMPVYLLASALVLFWAWGIWYLTTG